MTIAARINLQHGVPENKTQEGTNYTIESPLDAYIVQKQNIKERYNQRKREEQQQKALEEYISKLVNEKLQECLEESLNSILKDFR